jgi:hypothetical protein
MEVFVVTSMTLQLHIQGDSKDGLYFKHRTSDKYDVKYI